MGFKCPICRKDFGNDKAEFNKHLSEENFDFQNFLKVNAYESVSNVLNIINNNITDINRIKDIKKHK